MSVISYAAFHQAVKMLKFYLQIQDPLEELCTTVDRKANKDYRKKYAEVTMYDVTGLCAESTMLNLTNDNQAQIHVRLTGDSDMALSAPYRLLRPVAMHEYLSVKMWQHREDRTQSFLNILAAMSRNKEEFDQVSSITNCLNI